jgi:2-oxoglutarate ferredoxin oxidoreductase subunit delta
MAKIIIDREKCKGCLLCVSFCPKGLISVDKDLNRRGVKPVKFSPRPVLRSPQGEGGSFSKGGCLGCAMCAIICPDCCIEVYK